MFRMALCLCASLLVAGCALSEDAIQVRYSPPDAGAVARPSNGVAVTVVGKDGRGSRRDRVSTKKNGYGMEMAKITAANDLATEVANAVQSELQKLGFSVGPGGARISVELDTFYNDFKMGLFSGDAVAELKFTLIAYAVDGSILYTKSYQATGTNPNIMLMEGSQAKVALDAALREAVQQVTFDRTLHSLLLSAGKPKNAGAPSS
jgi:uncharacterized lipoprotein YajG